MKPQAAQHADSRHRPDRGRRGQPADLKAVLHDDARAKKTDAGYDALDGARGVDDANTKRMAAEPKAWRARSRRKDCRHHAHKAIGAHACGAAVIKPFIPEQQAHQQGVKHVENNGNVCWPVRAEQMGDKAGVVHGGRRAGAFVIRSQVKLTLN